MRQSVSQNLRDRIVSIRLAFPYDVIDASSLIGTEVGGLPGSSVVALHRLPVKGESDAAVMIVDVPGKVTVTYDDSPNPWGEEVI